MLQLKDTINPYERVIFFIENFQLISKYRNKDLRYREKSDTQSLQEELSQDLKFLEDVNGRQESLKDFFELYNEDTLGAAIDFALKAMKEMGEDYSALIEKIVKLNQLLFGKDNKYSSYLYFTYKEYIEQYNYEDPEVSKYTTLKKLVKQKTSYVRKKTDNIKTNLVKEELTKISNEYPLSGIIGQSFYSTVNLVTTNSCEMQRQCINALLSSLMQIEVSDDVILQKNNNLKSRRIIHRFMTKSAQINSLFQTYCKNEQ